MSDDILKYKLVILGDSGVGKTSLFKKLLTEKFEPKVISTIGIDKRTLNIKINIPEVGEKDVEIALYDTAGEERFRAISVSYFRDSNGILLMYDITKQNTFENLNNWLENLKTTIGDNENYLMILLGNKLDLVDEKIEKRGVEIEDAKDFCQENNIFWGGECSVKDIDIEKLKNMFKSFIEEIYKKVGDVKREESIVIEGKKNKDNKKKKKCC